MGLVVFSASGQSFTGLTYTSRLAARLDSDAAAPKPLEVLVFGTSEVRHCRNFWFLSLLRFIVRFHTISRDCFCCCCCWVAFVVVVVVVVGFDGACGRVKCAIYRSYPLVQWTKEKEFFFVQALGIWSLTPIGRSSGSIFHSYSTLSESASSLFVAMVHWTRRSSVLPLCTYCGTLDEKKGVFFRPGTLNLDLY